MSSNQKSALYITHCSAKKAEDYHKSGEWTTPEVLYTATSLQRFIERCKDQRVPWAIFSDLYGVWFPDKKHPWYEKNPSKVTATEFQALLADFDAKLGGYDDIWFYYPGRIHPLHRKLLAVSSLGARIHVLSHLRDIPASAGLCSHR
jgi:hypothetical protein